MGHDPAAPRRSRTRCPGSRYAPDWITVSAPLKHGLRRSPGSPPRAWGRLRNADTVACPDRFTPTRVGTTLGDDGRPRDGAVHPHARGDDGATAGAGGGTVGSPPRAWGRRGSPSGIRAGTRFTPTRVGTTSQPGWPCSASAVHPHARGDDGSIPSTWGRRPVHPHARGDDSGRRGPTTSRDGSPPRAWGRLTSFRRTRIYFRFTPTRVGTTAVRGRAARPVAVHPHARGDDGAGAVSDLAPLGSPPRAWGRLLMGSKATSLLRFTPTRVGTTASPSLTAARAAVHPHARGDDSLRRFAFR